MMICALALAASTAANAGAAGNPHGYTPANGHTIYQSPQLWATIDVCDGAQHPHTVGVRGSMPGSGRADELMYMRFQLQYRDSAGAWFDVGPAADSGFVAVGASSYRVRQAGRDFVLAVPAGRSFVVRGVVTFEWRRRGHVVRNAHKSTVGGHRALAGSDPPGFSAAVCTLR